MITLPRPRFWRVSRWSRELVVIKGSWFGIYGAVFVLGCVAMAGFGPLLFHPIGFALACVALALVHAVRFRVAISSSDIRVQGRFLGFCFEDAVYPTDQTEVAMDDEWGDSSVRVGQTTFSEELSGATLVTTIRAAIEHVQGNTMNAASLLALARSVDAPHSSVPVAVPTALIERHLAMNHEVLAVRGWTIGPNQRLLLYVVHQDRIACIFDAYVASDALAVLTTYPLTPAHCDEMAFTNHRRFVWTEGPFRLWRKGKFLAEVSHRGFWRRHQGTVPLNQIQKVEAWLSPGWIRMGIKVHAADRAIPIATTVNLGPVYDILYDGIDLLFDLGWVEGVTRILSEELQVPCVRDSLDA